MKVPLFKMLISGVSVLVLVSIIYASSTKGNNANIIVLNIEALAEDENTAAGDCSKLGGECSVKLPSGSELIITNMQKP